MCEADLMVTLVLLQVFSRLQPAQIAPRLAYVLPSFPRDSPLLSGVLRKIPFTYTILSPVAAFETNFNPRPARSSTIELHSLLVAEFSFLPACSRNRPCILGYKY